MLAGFFTLSLLVLATPGCYWEGRDNKFDPEADNYIGNDRHEKATAWTFMVYMGADNNLESELLSDINEMQQGMQYAEGINLIVFIDRSAAFDSDYYVLGENFSGGKMYRITADETCELYGQKYLPECRPENTYDVNSGDAEILKRFIQFGKKYYPAEKYALIISSHGGGAMKKRSAIGTGDSTNSSSTREVVGDYPENDWIYTAEVTDVLTEAESVDFLGYDACFMGSAEVAYQYRPDNGSFSADVMAASPASEWGYGWDFVRILSRIRSGGGTSSETADIVTEGTGIEYEKYYDATEMTALHLGGIIVEEYYDQLIDYNALSDQTMSCYDLSKAADVKAKVDALAKLLAGLGAVGKENVLDLGLASSYENSAVAMHYFTSDSEVPYFPFFDIYDLAARIENISGISSDISTAARNVQSVVDEMVVYSFGGSVFAADSFYGGEFQQGKNGLHIYFPYRGDFEEFGLWYYPTDTSSFSSIYKGYGKLSWCADGATAGNITVENWFELLDDWMDSGNSNGYAP